MDTKALDLIEYIKDDGVDLSQDTVNVYKDIMNALSDSEYLATLPEQFQDQKVVEDAFSICEARIMLLDPVADYYNDMIPEFLEGTEVENWFTSSVLYEIEGNIDKVFPDNYEYIESDAIETVIESETLENCEKILQDYVEYMKEEYDQDLEVYNNHGAPYIVKYGTERAVLDYDKIVEIAETSGSDYFNIKFDWGN